MSKEGNFISNWAMIRSNKQDEELIACILNFLCGYCIFRVSTNRISNAFRVTLVDNQPSVTKIFYDKFSYRTDTNHQLVTDDWQAWSLTPNFHRNFWWLNLSTKQTPKFWWLNKIVTELTPNFGDKSTTLIIFELSCGICS